MVLNYKNELWYMYISLFTYPCLSSLVVVVSLDLQTNFGSYNIPMQWGVLVRCYTVHAHLSSEVLLWDATQYMHTFLISAVRCSCEMLHSTCTPFLSQQWGAPVRCYTVHAHLSYLSSEVLLWDATQYMHTFLISAVRYSCEMLHSTCTPFLSQQWGAPVRC